VKFSFKNGFVTDATDATEKTAYNNIFIICNNGREIVRKYFLKIIKNC
jgi:hypothetical protein